jgi:hypothetical protein
MGICSLVNQGICGHLVGARRGVVYSLVTFNRGIYPNIFLGYT